MEQKNPGKILITSIVIILFIAIVSFIFILLKFNQYQKKVVVVTDKGIYNNGDILRVKIRNNLENKICFSSCYPYYLEEEKTGDGWESYKYSPCEASDVADKCVNPKEVKAFKIVLPTLQAGDHRLAIPACVSCNINQDFKKEEWVYSNKFVIKQ